MMPMINTQLSHAANNLWLSSITFCIMLRPSWTTSTCALTGYALLLMDVILTALTFLNGFRGAQENLRGTRVACVQLRAIG
jgi:hypothetical protein